MNLFVGNDLGATFVTVRASSRKMLLEDTSAARRAVVVPTALKQSKVSA